MRGNVWLINIIPNNCLEVWREKVEGRVKEKNKVEKVRERERWIGEAP